MRVHVVDKGPNMGLGIKINQEFLFRGTNYKTFKNHVKDRKYSGCNDTMYGLSTFVALNIDGAASYCGTGQDLLKGEIVAIYDDDVVFRDNSGVYRYLGNRPILLAIAHEKYPLDIPEGEEGFVIHGWISIDDIIIIKTERDLLKVLPSPYNLEDITIQIIKRRAGIYS